MLCVRMQIDAHHQSDQSDCNLESSTHSAMLGKRFRSTPCSLWASPATPVSLRRCRGRLVTRAEKEESASRWIGHDALCIASSLHDPLHVARPPCRERDAARGETSKSAVKQEEEEVDAYLQKVWAGVKKDVGKGLGPEEAQMLERINVMSLSLTVIAIFQSVSWPELNLSASLCWFSTRT